MTQVNAPTKPRRAAGFPVTIPVGKRVEIARSLEAGTLIYNTDNTNGVWLSSSEQVSVGNGIRLGAFGTLHWIGGACYGIVDTGVLTPVTLQISADSQDLINPVDTATAVAIALFAEGITTPINVYDPIFNGSVSGAGATIDVSTYASVHVFLSNNDGTSQIQATFSFVEPVSGLVIDHGLLSADCQIAEPSWPDWTLPVCAPQLKIVSSGAAVNALVVGTNRSLPKRLGSDMAPVRRFQGTIAAGAAAGTIVPMPGIDNNTNSPVPQINLSNYNGLVTYIWRTPGPNATGNLRMKWRDSGGGLAIQDPYPGQNFSTTANLLLGGHPFSYTRWEFQTNALQGGSPTVITLTIVPAGAPL